MGPGGYCHIGGMDRKAQQVNIWSEAGHLLLLPKLRPAKRNVLRAESKELQGLTKGRQPSPVPHK